MYYILKCAFLQQKNYSFVLYSSLHWPLSFNTLQVADLENVCEGVEWQDVLLLATESRVVL